MASATLQLYFVKGYFFNERLGVWQIIDEGLFAYSPEQAKQEIKNYYKNMNINEVKIYNVRLHEEECPQKEEKY